MIKGLFIVDEYSSLALDYNKCFTKERKFDQIHNLKNIGKCFKIKSGGTKEDNLIKHIDFKLIFTYVI